MKTLYDERGIAMEVVSNDLHSVLMNEARQFIKDINKVLGEKQEPTTKTSLDIWGRFFYDLKRYNVYYLRYNALQHLALMTQDTKVRKPLHAWTAWVFREKEKHIQKEWKSTGDNKMYDKLETFRNEWGVYDYDTYQEDAYYLRLEEREMAEREGVDW